MQPRETRVHCVVHFISEVMWWTEAAGSVAALGHAGARFSTQLFRQTPLRPHRGSAWWPRRPGRKVGESRRAAACAHLMAATDRDRRPATPRASSSAGVAGRKLARARKLRRSNGEGRGTGGGRADRSRRRRATTRRAPPVFPLAARPVVRHRRAPRSAAALDPLEHASRGPRPAGSRYCAMLRRRRRATALSISAEVAPMPCDDPGLSCATSRTAAPLVVGSVESARAAAGRPVDARATRTAPAVRQESGCPTRAGAAVGVRDRGGGGGDQTYVSCGRLLLASPRRHCHESATGGAPPRLARRTKCARSGSELDPFGTFRHGSGSP